MRRRRAALSAGVLVLVVAASLGASALASPSPSPPAPGGTKPPSRKPVKGCRWEMLSDAGVGLAAWVQRCDFGFRKIDFLLAGSSLAIRYTDGGGGGKPDPLVDVLDVAPGETAEKAVRRIFDERTDRAVASRCVLAPYRGWKALSRVRRFTFVPDPAYAKELAKKADPNEVGDPPCGEWGDAPDGIQYFEAHPGSRARKVLFVRIGQDEPLFDERTLRLLE